MDTLPNSEPGEQPAAAELAGAEPQIGDIESALDALDDDGLESLIDHVESGKPLPETEPQAAAAESPAQTEQPSGEEPEAEPEAGTEATTEQRPPQRVSLRRLAADQQTAVASAIAMVANGEAADIAEAIAKVTGKTVAAANPDNAAQTGREPEEAAAPAKAEAPAEVESMKARLQELRKERKQARLDYDIDKEEELDQQIEDLQLEMVRAEQAAQVRQVEARGYQERFQAACDTVEAKYPDAAKDDSPFSRILDDRVAAARARKDPALKDPNFIQRFADEVAADLGLATKPKAPAPAPPARNARPVGTAVVPGHGSAQRMSAEQARESIKSLSDEDLDALVSNLG